MVDYYNDFFNESFYKTNMAYFDDYAIKNYIDKIFQDGEQIKNLEDWQKFFSGLSKFYHHPYQRKADDYTILKQIGSANIIAYNKKSLTKAVILFIPSLINKSYIIDLKKGRSLVKYLGRDLNVTAIDWQEPSDEESSFKIEDYIIKRVIPAINFIAKEYNQKVILAGYCMGGMLAVAAAILAKNNVSSLISLATPWNFAYMKMFENLPFNEQSLGPFNKIPATIVQGLFYLQNFPRVFTKFINFASMDQNSSTAEDFVAVEKWVNDGISLAKPLMSQLANDFCKLNITINNKWEILGKKIEAKNIKVPAFFAIPENDIIVPPASTNYLAVLTADKTIITVPSGHVGMIIGSNSRKYLWLPLKKWLSKQK
jgi:polyhydroxyalkanoate synthase